MAGNITTTIFFQSPGTTWTFNKSQIQRIIVGSKITDTPEKYFTGTISQHANIALFDTDLSLKDLARRRALRPDLRAHIDFEGTRLADMVTGRFKYGLGSSTATNNFIDTILGLDSASFTGVATAEGNTGLTFWNALIAAVNRATGQTINTSTATRTHLQRMGIDDGFLSAGNLRERMDEFLGVAGMVVYRNPAGQLWGIVI